MLYVLCKRFLLERVLDTAGTICGGLSLLGGLYGICVLLSDLTKMMVHIQACRFATSFCIVYTMFLVVGNGLL